MTKRYEPKYSINFSEKDSNLVLLAMDNDSINNNFIALTFVKLYIIKVIRNIQILKVGLFIILVRRF